MRPYWNALVQKANKSAHTQSVCLTINRPIALMKKPPSICCMYAVQKQHTHIVLSRKISSQCITHLVLQPFISLLRCYTGCAAEQVYYVRKGTHTELIKQINLFWAHNQGDAQASWCESLSFTLTGWSSPYSTQRDEFVLKAFCNHSFASEPCWHFLFCFVFVSLVVFCFFSAKYWTYWNIYVTFTSMSLLKCCILVAIGHW